MESKTPLQITNENLLQLELPNLLNKLQELLVTPYSGPHLHGMGLLFDKQMVKQKLTEVSEMTDLIRSGYNVPIGEMDDVLPLLDRLKPEDAFLEAPEINQVKSNLAAFEELNRFFQNRRENCPELMTYINRIHPHRAVVKEIEGSIDPHGEIREDASPELRRIRREIHRLENEQKNILNKVLKKYSEFSQEDIVTLRDGRMVLGIQQHYVNRVNGIVHGTSGTGATVFIEPMETLRLSNRIQSLKIDERNEIIRILKFLAGLVREIRNDIYYSIENLGILDLIHAKARLSVLMDAAEPNISEGRELRLLNARHPLLLLKMGHQNVVPATLQLGKDYFTLVITGPNAGGKTVVLKTVGLLVAMTQMGLHIPAQPDSVLPLFDEVLVDIGDRQSLEQDLSTFSAHIIRLQDILRKANTHTLVLVDEIGTGTDPREGAALAIAFIRELTERKALTVATTHHGELKAFAYSTENIRNASMQFDVETLQPTYHLQVGIPGSSYAFEIARRYGFSESVLSEAEKMVGKDKGQLESLILDLNERLQEASKDQRQLSIRLSEAEGLRKLYQNEMERLKREKKELRRQAAEEAKKIVEQANARIENAVAEIRSSQAQKEKIREAHQGVEELRESVGKIMEETRPRIEQSEVLHQGDVVWSDELREEGELLSEPNSRGKAWVLIGSMKMKMEVAGLKKVAKSAAESRPRILRREKVSDTLEAGVSPELDLRGMDSFQAVEAADRYLTQAANQGWEEVRIIHGKGSGVLRREINRFLNKDERVESKRLGKWGEGDTGVTIVQLKK